MNHSLSYIKRVFVSRRRGHPFLCLLGLVVFCAVPSITWAQEAVRMSLASVVAAEARREAAATLGYYNVKLGPSVWRFGSALGFEWNDNIQLETDAPKSDLILRPEVSARMLWPVSQFNQVSLALSAGYSAYCEHSEFDRAYIRPGSEVSFDLYAGDLWINVYDRFSILEDNYLDPTVTGVGGYSRLENAAGAMLTWDLNEALARLEYTHLNYVELEDNEGAQPDGASELLALSLGYLPQAGVLAGVELGGGLVRYEEDPQGGYDQGTQWNAGLFADCQITQYLKARGSAGYTVFSPDGYSTVAPDPGDFSGMYAQLVLTHRVNQHVRYTLSTGRQVSFTFYGGTVDLYYGRLGIDWNVLRKISLSTGFEAEHGEYITFGEEKFTRMGPSIRMGRQLMKQLSASLEYRFYSRHSDQSGRDYSANIGRAALVYTF